MRHLSDQTSGGRPMQEFIRKIAYTIWERDGRPDGKDLDHWFRAEAVVRRSLRGHGGIADMFEADRAMPALPSPMCEVFMAPRRNPVNCHRNPSDALTVVAEGGMPAIAKPLA